MLAPQSLAPPLNSLPPAVLPLCPSTEPPPWGTLGTHFPRWNTLGGGRGLLLELFAPPALPHQTGPSSALLLLFFNFF